MSLSVIWWFVSVLRCVPDLPVVAINFGPSGLVNSLCVCSTTLRSWLLTVGPSGLMNSVRNQNYKLGGRGKVSIVRYIFAREYRDREGAPLELPGFGRKDKEDSDGEERKNHPGHQAVLRHLAEKEKDDPLIRPQVTAGIVFDLYVRILGADGGRVRIEDLIAALASIGGYLCLLGVMIQLKVKGMTLQEIGMVDVLGKDGHHYFFGDQPNRLLLESPDLTPEPGPGRSQVPRRSGHAGDGA